jgi:hypothetical protein
LEFEARVLLQGYIHKIEVIVDDMPVSFEHDEEHNYRALITVEQLEAKGKNLNKGLIQEIITVLNSLGVG